MATEEKTAPASELDDVALRIFTERVAAGRTGEAVAIDSFRQAEMFLAVRKRVRAGELSSKKAAGKQLADCCAPNLPHTHPINLVAREYFDRRANKTIEGSLRTVNRILKWLKDNPTPETDPEQLVERCNYAHHDMGLNWDLPTINIARAIFPAYEVPELQTAAK